MGKRTSQAAPPVGPAPRKKRRSLLGTTARVLAITAGVLLVLFVAGGWYFSGEIESGALDPPKSGPPDLEWEVTGTGSGVELSASPGTDQAGEHGASGLWWSTGDQAEPSGYTHSDALVSSTEADGSVVDTRSIVAGSDPPPEGADVKVDVYYWRGTPEVHGVEYSTVQYTSDVGSFPAWYIEGTSDTWAIVVHGKGGTPEEALRVIPLLQRLGYPILVIHYRNDVGLPRDPSGHHTYGVTDWRDVAAAVTYAEENGATDHILVGYSYAGSMITSFLTQSPLRNRTTAAILDSPVLSLSDTVDFRASDTNLPLLPFTVPGILTDFAKWISTWRFDVDWTATDYLEQTAEIHAPTLIFHGTEDISVPYDTSAELAERRPDIVTLVTTEAGHTRSWNLDPDAYEDEIISFLTGLE